MNDFSSIENSGLLKPDYEPGQSAMSKALKRKRDRLAETMIGLEPDEEDHGKQGNRND